MRTGFLLLISFLTSQHCLAQEQNPWVKLSTLHIYENDLLVNLLPPDSAYTFRLEVLNEYADTSYGFKAEFNPKVIPQWKIRIDSMQATSETEQAEIEKRNLVPPPSALHINEKSLTGAVAVYYYIIQFTVDSNRLPEAYSYLKNCKATAYINMPNKDLEKIVWENTKPFRFENINVSSFHLDVYPDFIDGRYRVIKEWFEITGRQEEGMPVHHKTALYSGYKKL